MWCRRCCLVGNPAVLASRHCEGRLQRWLVKALIAVWLVTGFFVIAWLANPLVFIHTQTRRCSARTDWNANYAGSPITHACLTFLNRFICLFTYCIGTTTEIQIHRKQAAVQTWWSRECWRNDKPCYALAEILAVTYWPARKRSRSSMLSYLILDQKNKWNGNVWGRGVRTVQDHINLQSFQPGMGIRGWAQNRPFRFYF